MISFFKGIQHRKILKYLFLLVNKFIYNISHIMKILLKNRTYHYEHRLSLALKLKKKLKKKKLIRWLKKTPIYIYIYIYIDYACGSKNQKSIAVQLVNRVVVHILIILVSTATNFFFFFLKGYSN